MKRIPVTVIVDRPLGSAHPEYPGTVYPLNYGYVPDVPAGDGEEQDVYILGVERPLERFEGMLIAVVRRRDDAEDKWVAAPAGLRFTEAEIAERIAFAEKWFDSAVELTED